MSIILYFNEPIALGRTLRLDWFGLIELKPYDNVDMAAKRRKKHKNKISGLVISMGYEAEIWEFWLFTRLSKFNFEFFLCLCVLVAKFLDLVF